MPDPRPNQSADVLLLLEALRRGDPSAFDVFGRTFGGRMRAIAERLLAGAGAPGPSEVR